MMNKVNSFKDLKVWQLSHEITKCIYEMTNNFPKSEIYGLVSQLKRCSSSVPANIAEGKGRRTIKEFRQFLINARGSNEETKYFLILSRDLNFIEQNVYELLEDKTDHVGRMLNKLIYTLEEQ